MKDTSRLSKNYQEISKLLEDTEYSTKLLIISNLLFDCYDEAKRADLLYNELDKPRLETIEDYSYMKEIYAFNENSYVFITLDRAHDLLRLSLDLDKIKYGINK